MATLDIRANASLWAAVLRIATPLLFGRWERFFASVWACST
jgi:hypothetical protein